MTARAAVRLARRAAPIPDRLLHNGRRRQARARIARIDRLESALFICLGNINRSAYAAATFAREMKRHGIDGVEVTSAGFIGPGRPSPAEAQRVATRRGVDLSAHVSRLVNLEEVTRSSVIIVMDAAQRRRISSLAPAAAPRIFLLGDFDPGPVRTRAVQDPYGFPEDVFEAVFTRVDDCITDLTDALASLHPHE